MLADRAGVELESGPRAARGTGRRRRRSIELNAKAQAYYQHVLWSTPAGEPGRDLLRDRGVEEALARTFRDRLCAGRWRRRGRARAVSDRQGRRHRRGAGRGRARASPSAAAGPVTGFGIASCSRSATSAARCSASGPARSATPSRST